MLFNHHRNYGCRIHEVIYKGLKTVILENETIRVSILADRGTDIFEFLYKPLDVDYLWKSYLDVKPQNYIFASCQPDGNFLDYFHGGWQELFPNGGDACEYKGAPLPQHGEVFSIPWEYNIIEDEPESIKIKFYTRTYRTYFLIEKTYSIFTKKSCIFIDEKITNECREDMDFMWGHHPSFGPPFLSDKCVIDLPDCEVINDEVDLSPTTGRLKIAHKSKWPITKGRKGENIDLSKIPSIDVNSHDRAYISGFKEGWYAIRNTENHAGFGLAWDPELFKYLWFWQVYGGAIGYPWFSTTYNIAIEPNTSYPPGLNNAIKNKTSILLKPGESISSRMAAYAFSDNSKVKKIDLQGNIEF